jgi:hypothetical protein
MFKNKLITVLGIFALFSLIASGAVGGCHDNNGNGDGDGSPPPLDGDGLTTITIMNSGSDSVCVAISFGADSCFTASDLGSLCTNTTECPVLDTGMCNFELAGNSSQDITTSDNQTNCTGSEEALLTIGLNPTDPCSVTQVEFTLYANAQDSYDISLVNGFNLPVEIEADLGPPTPGECGPGNNAGPVTSATGNQMACGVFPLGCANCTNQDGQPCNFPNPNNTVCKTGTPDDPDVPCTLNQGSGGSFTVIINPTIPAPTPNPVPTCPPGTCSGCSSQNPFCCPTTGGCANSVGGLSGCLDPICTIE